MSYTVDFEFFYLFMHVVEESGEILGNLLISNQMLGVLASVKLGDKVSTRLINVLNCIREFEVLFFRILEPNWTQVLKFISHSSLINGLL